MKDCASSQCAALFSGADREVQVVDVGQRPAAQDGVAVAAHRKAMLGTVDEMGHAEGRAQELGLIVKVRSRHVFCDLLEQSNVGFLLLEHREHALDTITPINPANALVDVPADDAEAHVERGRSLDGSLPNGTSRLGPNRPISQLLFVQDS